MPVKRYKTKKRSYRPRKAKVNRRRKSAAHKRVRSLILGVLTILIAVVVLTGFVGYKFVKAPFSSASVVNHEDTEIVWNEDLTNIIFVKVDDINDPNSQIKSLSLVCFDNTHTRYYIYNFPVDTEFEYPDDYGVAAMSDLYRIGNENNGNGIELIQKMIKKNLAISSDGYVLMDEDGVNHMKNYTGDINLDDLSAVLRIKNTLNVPKMISIFRDEAVTNMKIADVYKVLRFIKSTSETSSEVYELNKYHILDDSNWDQLWVSNLGLSEVKKESVKVLIVNGSKEPKIPGLASWGSRVTQNIGASVLDSENAFAEYEESLIIADNKELETVKLLKRTLGIEKVVSHDELSKMMEYNPKIDRAEVTLVLTNF